MFSCHRPLPPGGESSTRTGCRDIFWYRTVMPEVKHLYLFICMVNILGKSEALGRFLSICCLLLTLPKLASITLKNYRSSLCIFFLYSYRFL